MEDTSNPPSHWPQSIGETLFGNYLPEWQMTEAERCALIMLLNEIRPACAIEIGTAQGGSLSALARFSEKVYSLDINPACREQLGPKFPNAEFITGNSQKTLPPLLKRLQAASAGLGFVLIDGAHSRDGVRQDIENLLKFRPPQLLQVVLHDSFNPECRQGMIDADWAKSPYVHFVELDFVPGIFHSHPDRYREMWGGLALAILLPVERKGNLAVHANQDLLFQTVLQHSISHRRPDHRLIRLFRRFKVPAMRSCSPPRD